MTKEECRICAQRRIPVVLRETGTVPEIVFPFIREIKVIYASDRERAAGYPPERLAVLLADRSGHSFTEALPRQLRLPSEDEAMGAVPESWTLDEVDEMLEFRRFLAEKAESGAGEAESGAGKAESGAGKAESGAGKAESGAGKAESGAGKAERGAGERNEKGRAEPGERSRG